MTVTALDWAPLFLKHLVIVLLKVAECWMYEQSLFGDR